jgi:hypothetical protein
MMTPVPIDLPLRPSEAAALASLVYEHAGERRLSDDVRSRLAGRASTLGLKTVAPYFGSLEPDPVHPATYYLAVDGLAGQQRTPLLLHMTPASSPASGLFPKALLIGRMRPAASREIVMNAIPFRPDDSAPVSTFATEISRSFLPRAHGALPLIWVDTAGNALAAADALHAFRSLLRSTGLNIAGLRCGAGLQAFWQIVWAAIRAGYREGYSLAGGYEKDLAKWLSCFRVHPDEALDVVHSLRSVRGGVPFDIEVDLRGAGPSALERLKSCGVVPQFVLSDEGVTSPGSVTSIEVEPADADDARRVRQRVHGPCAVTLRWNGGAPAVAPLLEALR